MASTKPSHICERDGSASHNTTIVVSSDATSLVPAKTVRGLCCKSPESINSTPKPEIIIISDSPSLVKPKITCPRTSRFSAIAKGQKAGIGRTDSVEQPKKTHFVARQLVLDTSTDVLQRQNEVTDGLPGLQTLEDTI